MKADKEAPGRGDGGAQHEAVKSSELNRTCVHDNALVGGVLVIRCAIEHHVAELWKLIQENAEILLKN
ncbi:hypothetical protein SLA2020_042020 [Shorea laevis]